MEAIPLEIWAQVLNFMDVNSKLKLRCTCTYLFEIIDRRDFVIYFARSKQLPEMVKVFSRYNKPIGLTFKKTKKINTKAVNYLSKLTNLINLKFDNDDRLKKKGSAYGNTLSGLAGLVSLTNLRSLSFGSDKNFIDEDVLYSMNNLTHISLAVANKMNVLDGKTNLVSFDLGSLDDFSLISNIEQLTSLKIGYFFGTSNNQVKGLERATNLQSLFVNSQSQVRLPLHKLPSLQSLQLQGLSNIELGECTNLTKLVLYNVTATKEEIRNWTSLTNIKSWHFTLFWVKNAGNGDPTYESPTKDEFRFITALMNLSDFSSDILDEYGSLDLLRSDNLTSLKIYINNNEANRINRLTGLETLLIFDSNCDVDYNFLTAFMKLKRLEIGSTMTETTCQTLTCVQHLTALKILKVKYTPVVYDGTVNPPTVKFNFADLLQLEELQVPYITQEAFVSLQGLTRLTTLTADSGAQFRPEVLAKLPLKVLHMPNCAFLNMTHNIEALISLKSLESLCVGFRDASSAKTRLLSLTALQHLTALQVQYYDNINFEHLARLTNLQKLRLYRRKKKFKNMPFLYDYTTYK